MDHHSYDSPFLLVRCNDHRVAQVPKFQQFKVLWNRDPRWTIVLGTVRHICSLMVINKVAEEYVKYGMMKAMMARRDHDGPSRGSSTQTRFDRFSVSTILLLLGFCFYYK